ncbi:MAG: hypothetical protein V4850_16185 [Myxococcota bacterium]
MSNDAFGHLVAPYTIECLATTTDAEILVRLALVANTANPNLCEHQGILKEVRNGRLREMPAGEMEAILAQHVMLGVPTREGRVLRSVPHRYAHHLRNRPHGYFPLVEIVLFGPGLLPDGTLALSGGLRKDQGVYVDWKYPPIDPSMVSRDTIREVVQRLLDFPFESEADCATAFGAMLTPLTRADIRGACPLVFVTSTGSGAGKTYLARVIGAIALGRDPEVRGLTAWNAEASRELHTYLLSDPRILLLDNLPTGGTVGGADLHRLISATSEIGLRPMGSGKERFVLPRALWVATANHASIDDEMVRRTVFVRLRCERGRPRLTPDLIAWVLENRALVLAVLLHIVQAWLDAGRPGPSRSRPGFDEWSAVVGGIVEHAGLPGWLAVENHPVSEENNEIAEMLRSWPQAVGAFAELRPHGAYKHVKERGLYVLAARLEEGVHSPRSIDTNTGRFLTLLVRSGRGYGGLRLSERTGHAGRFYKPVPEGSP